jgi:hypothetical protein
MKRSNRGVQFALIVTVVFMVVIATHVHANGPYLTGDEVRDGLRYCYYTDGSVTIVDEGYMCPLNMGGLAE